MTLSQFVYVFVTGFQVDTVVILPGTLDIALVQVPVVPSSQFQAQLTMP
jgi:hypothetical protein